MDVARLGRTPHRGLLRVSSLGDDAIVFDAQGKMGGKIKGLAGPDLGSVK